MVRGICRLFDEMQPDASHRLHESLIQFVTDRTSHDSRDAIDASKLGNEQGRRPRRDFDSGPRDTARWFLNNRSWWERVLSGAYRGKRLGLIRGS